MAKTGAEILISALEQQGVEVIFGYPGGAILPVFNNLSKSNIKHVLTRGEQAAAHAANGYARISRKVGVCMATSGPGATNLVTGIANAFLDSIPIVAITGQVNTSMVGTDAFQEVDITGITQPITKHNYLVTDADDIPRVVKEAFYIASSGRPGPVLIDIPKDVANGFCGDKLSDELELPGYKPNYKGHTIQVKHACEALLKAKRPLIYAGGGINLTGAYQQLLTLAERISAPVVTTLMGMGAFPFEHPLFLGMPGVHGFPAANYGLCNADVILALGVRFDERVTSSVEKFAPKAKIIHIDIDPAEISKNVSSHIPIVGDVKTVIEDMLKRLSAVNNQERLAEIAELKSKNEYLQRRLQSDQINPRQIVEKMSDILPSDAIITTDVGLHQMTVAQYYRHCFPGCFLTSGGLGTMGYGLPAAIGAQLAAPDRKVVCVTGDGSLQMSLTEMATINAQKLPIKILLFNNSCLGMVRQLEEVSYPDDNFYAVDLDGNPDFCRLAEAYGWQSFRLEKAEDIDSILTEAFSSAQPVLIDCIIDKKDYVFPMVLNGRPLNEMLMP